MYYVMGANNHQYGPVDEATLRQWIGEGRVGAATPSYRVGEPDWIPVGSRPELREVLAAAPPPPPVAAPPAVAPPFRVEGKDWLAALLFSIFLGYLGIDRFYMGQVGLGVGKLLTGGGCGVWWVIDIILIATGSARDSDGRQLVKNF